METPPCLGGFLGGSWVVISVISRVISRVTIDTTYVRGLVTPLVTTHVLSAGT